MDVRWRYGVFLGRALHSDMNYIGLHDGTLITARAICRVVPSARWSYDRLNRVTGTPYDLKLEHDKVEKDVNPHDHNVPETVTEDADFHRNRVTLSNSQWAPEAGLRSCWKV